MSEPGTLQRSRPRVSVLDLPREQIIHDLRRRLQGRNVSQAYIFGSFAEGSSAAWSDIDLIVVWQTDAPFIERPRSFWDLLEFDVPIDILVYTPQEFARLWSSDEGFWRTVRAHHIKLI